jgi:diguanylate cyclase
MSTSLTATQSLQGARDKAQLRRQTQQRRLVLIVASFHAIDAALLFCYAQVGVVPYSAGWLFVLVGVIIVGYGATAARHQLAKRWGVTMVAGPMAIVSSAMIVYTTFWLPQISVLMLLTLANVIASSALRLRTAYVFVGTAVLTACAVSALAVHGQAVSLPMADRAEVLISCAWVAFILYRGALINLTGVAHRAEISDVNTRLSDALAQIERLASRDDLTGLANRRSMRYLLEAAEQDHQRPTKPHAIMMLDIDHFKSVNDRFGHPVGDEVLRQFARVVETMSRSSDVVARWGGEEFLVMASGQRNDQSMRDASERVRRAVEAHDWSVVAPGLAVTTSIGMTWWQPNETADVAIARADELLYKAKAQGRNRVCSQ